MKNAIEITGLNKTYAAEGKSPEKEALKDINLTIPQGSMFGLLGPNGAGKSTIINIMAGLVMKSSGSVKIWGRDIDENPRNSRAAIGIVPQEINFDPFFTPRKILDIQGGLYGRLMVAKALVHMPPILVLDEPTAGVDVELRQMLWENVRKLNRDGMTILLTTHYLEEAEELCDQIAIINHGEIVANEEKETLLSRIDAKEIRFRFDKEIKEIPSALNKYNPTKEGRRTIALRYSPNEQCIDDIIKIVQKIDNPICDISTDESDLEDIFLQITRN